MPAQKAVLGSEAIALSPDGRRIAAGTGSWRRGGPTGSTPGRLRYAPSVTVWRASDGSRQATWAGGRGPVWGPAYVASENLDGGIDLRHPATGRVVRSLSGVGEPSGMPELSGRIASTVFTPDGSQLLASGRDGTVHAWRTATGEHLWTRRLGCSGLGVDLAVSADGPRLACVGRDVPLRVIPVDTGADAGPTPPAPSGSSSGGDAGGRGLAYSRDGRRLATGHGDTRGRVVVRDAATLAVERVVELPNAPGHLAFSPDGAHLAISLPTGLVVQVVPVAAGGGAARTLRGHTNAPEAVAFSPDGRVLYSASTHDGILAWDPASGSLRRRLR